MLALLLLLMKRKSHVTLFLLLCLTGSTVFGQGTTVDHYFNTWWMNINTYKLSEKSFLSSEIHVRRANGVRDWQQFIFRPAFNHDFNATVNGAVGYSLLRTYPFQDTTTLVTLENNVWEQVQLSHEQNDIKFMHRFRLEHRFIGKKVVENGSTIIKGTQYKQRFRYRYTMQVPLLKKGKVFGVIFDEVWLNMANNFMPTGLNQNWFYAGLGYNVNHTTRFELGYMNQLSKFSNTQYESNYVIQTSLFLKFFEKEEAKE